jgi:uncharacterized membrane protein YkoI
MRRTQRFVIAAVTVCALGFALAPACAADAADAPACLNQKERRAEVEAGRIIRLDRAMHAARGRMPGTVVRARLCRGNDGLVYVLTVLARDGKVARIAVDAVNGALVGGF